MEILIRLTWPLALRIFDQGTGRTVINQSRIVHHVEIDGMDNVYIEGAMFRGVHMPRQYYYSPGLKVQTNLYRSRQRAIDLLFLT